MSWISDRANQVKGKLRVAASIRPRAWTPPPAPPLAGEYAANERLASAELWETGGIGPEDVVVDDQGRAYAGLEDGTLLRFDAPGKAPSHVGNTGGRPLGLELDADRNLIVCDAERGLLRVRPDGRTEVLVDRYEGRRFRFTNNAAIASDGTIYFSDSSTDFGIHEYRADLLAHRPAGRLFAHDPTTGETRLLLTGLYFANGVALASDESFVLVAETSAYRIARLWLTGPRAGERDTFVSNLPGFPDNLSSSGGIVWVPMPTPRDRALDLLLPRPRLRKLVGFLPEAVQPQPVRHGLVLGLDESGAVVHNLQDSTGRCAMITGARQFEDWLYLGSLTEPNLARYRLG